MLLAVLKKKKKQKGKKVKISCCDNTFSNTTARNFRNGHVDFTIETCGNHR